ncbi:Dolichyl N-acetyl-alpha-D-glucosaminyl phosphate 3-beta-D-2,3-diacetamido-2,3-dideoxy-beta-D-glucuronosyltransferase [uncultured archaeon]|nr:Dolichyl N-acetyl-alpha-D-glucosaminyl phosphate 3-beta-D-2,3-diacetamido-2,3-dideoxy-beta-D-glucuronosyltransferase [uncultured archaeon]
MAKLNKSPKISIIIPTKNEANYIEKTIKQYLPYKKKHGLEIIIADGGSTDKTVAIARKHADVVVLPNLSRKQNIAIGRNAGAKHARGEILFHTDADVIIPNKNKFFKRIIKEFEKNHIVATTTKLQIYPWEEKLRDKVFHHGMNGLIQMTSKFSNLLGKGECQIVRASTFRKIGGYNEAIIVGEDCNLFYRLGKLGKISYLKDTTIYHSPRRFRKNGYTKTLFSYLRESFSLAILGRSSVDVWEEAR